jgi:undecaprenyl phosphate N,N'-diacetylbacillosamine 1-phosphate transferase
MTIGPAGRYARTWKRAVDLIGAAGLVITTAPLLVLAALAVAASSSGPVLFRQKRLGRQGRTFDVLKFRTMTHIDRDQHVERFGAAEGVTTIGRWLRRTKVDELPQLFNVLRGDMSLVGPRPALPAQLADYDAESRRRLLVRPGMTGLAQVHGNIHLTWQERWRWDVTYVDRLSLWLDLEVLTRTVLVVLIGEGHFTASPPTTHGRAT